MSVSSSGSSTSGANLGFLNTAQTLSALLGTSSTSLTSLGAPLTLSGLSSGIDTAQIVAELMQVNQIPQQQLQTRLNSVSVELGSYETVINDVATLQSVSDTLASPSGWQAWIPQSSNAAATATVGAGALGGSLTFTVDATAQADSMISSGSVSSQSAQIIGGPLLVAAGGGALGVATLSSSNLSVGNHTIAVTQASHGASLTGSTAAATSTTIVTGSNDTLTYTVDGAAQTLTIAAGTYNASQLAAAVQSASGGQVTASVNNGGDMVLTTTAQGSGTSLQVTGGDGAAVLGFNAPTGTASGTDGVVTVDGVANTLSNFSPGTPVTLTGPNGSTVTATFSSPLTTGSMSAAEVNTGNGSLAAVVQAINATGLGISASIITTGTNQYNLSLQSTSSGAANTVNIDPNAFSGIGQLLTATPAADAQVTVGTGPGAFTVTNDTNQISGLMPGVTINLLQADPGQPTTISLQPDGKTMADTVQSLVTAANQLIKDLNTGTAYTPGTGSEPGTAGPLLGDPTAEALLRNVLGAISGQAGVNSTGSAGLVGVSINKDGTLDFNPATFSAAYDANPTAVANTFLSGGTSSNPLLSFYQSTDATAPGDYQVVVTQAASQATDLGAAPGGGTVSTPETLTITTGPASASYTTTAGESLSDIAAGLNQALAHQNVSVNVSVVNGALQLASTAYGSGASFTVSSTAAGAGTTGLAAAANQSQVFSGTDAEGTINGQPATGTGQFLQGATGTAAQGLLVLVDATPAQLAAAGGSTSATISYRPGVAQALAQVAYGAGNPVNGTVIEAINGKKSSVSSLQKEIDAWGPVLQKQEAQLTQEYNNMETALATLKTTQSYLSQYMNLSSSSSGSGH